MHKQFLAMTLTASMMLLGPGYASGATVVFEDNFDTENGGSGALNYESFSNWTVTDGTVDLIGDGFFDFLPGNGMYVDLDGTTFEVGTLTSKDLGLDVGLYELSFDLAGPAAGPASGPVEVTVGSAFSEQYHRDVEADFETSVAQFSVFEFGTFNLQFAQLGESNNIGLMLDNVKLSMVSDNPHTPVSVPTPSAALGGLALLGSLVFARRRRESRVA